MKAIFATLEGLGNGCIACLEECRNVLLNQNAVLAFPIQFLRVQEDHPDWSNKQALGYSVYQFIKSQVADGVNSELLKICSHELGHSFSRFACEAFMSEATGFLIQYIVDQLFLALFPSSGTGGCNGNGTDKWEWIIDLIIFILKYIIVPFICRCCGPPDLLNQFLLLILPHFLKWVIDKIRK